MAENQNLIPFEGKPIRKVWHNEEWYFSIIDVIEVLTDSTTPRRYWTDLKRRDEKENKQVYDFCVPTPPASLAAPRNEPVQLK